MVGRQVGREDVQEDVERTVGIEVKVTDETDHPTPDRRSPFVDCLSRFYREACSGRVCRTDAASNFCNQFAVSFRLFSEEVDFILLVTEGNVSASLYTKSGDKPTKDSSLSGPPVCPSTTCRS